MQIEANELQRATSELAKKQLEILLREEKERNAARLSFYIFKDGKTYRFRITNISGIDAKNVGLGLLVKPEDSPLVKNDYEAKAPCTKAPTWKLSYTNRCDPLGNPYCIQCCPLMG
ncbi:hypothetical protein HMF8227_01299 [Saliniradius amylolyticus]|uniref:Uncharacterized protein n=1 Tax=Saliniradius amylolyticus TaxID=2183582 RepID=A0A2S2E440_9ALTE|nr:hypothetical protein [Saliniradius amylolyticus]AWL11777.1 hypothetical protein HMF8227_01299 [Saliniradius amylolyticus]